MRNKRIGECSTVEVCTITRSHAVFLVLVTFSALAGAVWLLWLLE